MAHYCLRRRHPQPYVVKLYTEKNNEENNTVLKEAICSILADQLDIKTPDAALIDFTDDFIKSLPVTARNTLKGKDYRPKFGTRLLSQPYENFSPALSEKYLEWYDLATIYAFDNLILNVDRRIDKPNLFFNNDRVIVLDHELTLATCNSARQDILSSTGWHHNFKRHLFFSDLMSLSGSEKSECFDTFAYSLENFLDERRLSGIFDQMSELGHPVGDFFIIRNYLNSVRLNASKFISLLKATINE